jgi:hypothetical protein
MQIDLHERLDAEWRSWRQALKASDESSAVGRAGAPRTEQPRKDQS